MRTWYLRKEGLGTFLPHDKVERFKPLLFPYDTSANVNIQGMASACETESYEESAFRSEASEAKFGTLG